MKKTSGKKILVVGGAGYVGTPLCHKLNIRGHEVFCYDTFWFNSQSDFEKHSISTVRENLINADWNLHGQSYDIIICLACLSNDPSAEINEEITRKINYESTIRLIDWASNGGCKKFIYASSSSVYGIKEEEQVTENLTPAPLTLYSKYKLAVEEYLKSKQSNHFDSISIRPATVFGPSQRLRLDVIINILTAHGFYNKKIKVFGGDQYRPNIYIDDLISFYCKLIDVSDHKCFNGKAYNAGAKNYTVSELAYIVKKCLENRGLGEIAVETTPTNDQRSYRINSDQALKEFSFQATTSFDQGIDQLISQLETIKKDEWKGPQYYNIERIKNLINSVEILL